MLAMLEMKLTKKSGDFTESCLIDRRTKTTIRRPTSHWPTQTSSRSNSQESSTPSADACAARYPPLSSGWECKVTC